MKNSILKNLSRPLSQALFIFLILFFSSAFLWDGDEKDLGVLSAEAKSLMDSQRFKEASEKYQSILKRIDVRRGTKNLLGWQAYIDCSLQLTSAFIELGEWDKASAQITSLEIKNPPPEYLPRIKLLSLRIETQKEDASKVFIELTDLFDRYPSVQWRPEELAFYQGLRISLDERFEDALKKGRRLALAGFHEQALPLFKEVLAAVKVGAFPRARGSPLLEKYLNYLIAESHYACAHFSESLTYLNPSNQEEPLDLEMLYLSALCYKKQQDYENAVKCFQSYLSKANKDQIDHYLHAIFELGYRAYLEKRYEEAKKYLEPLLEYLHTPTRPVTVGALYLCKLYIELEEFENASELLSNLEKMISKEERLYFDVIYLKGEIAFKKQLYLQASQYFEHSLDSKERGNFRHQALYQLALSKIYESEIPKYTKQEQGSLLKEAEKHLLSLLHSSLKEPALFSLVQTYLKLENIFENPSYRERAIQLLRREGASIEGQLLLVEILEDEQEKEDLLENLLKQKMDPSARSKAWQLLGCHYFKKEGKDELQKAISAFEKAMAVSCSLDVHILHSLVENLHSPSDSLNELLTNLLEHLKETASLSEEQLYIKGLISYSLHYPVEEVAPVFELFAKKYPQSKFRSASLLMMGKMLYREKLYERSASLLQFLVKNTPYASQIPEALYYLLCSQKALQLDIAIQKESLKKLLDNYSHSPFAALSYFEFFPYTEYTKGSDEAIHHLVQFESLFPASPLNVIAHKLLGEHLDCLDRRVWHLKKAFEGYELIASQRIKDNYTPYAIDAQIALAKLLYKEKKKPELALRALFELPKKCSLSHQTWQHTLLLQAECLIAMGKNSEAARLLNQVIKNCKEEGVKRSYDLSRAWELQGDLATEFNIETAQKNYECALLAKPGKEDERSLEIGLKMSECYTKLQLFDAAIRTLSQTINADVASTLRIKAMLKRAELYEMQNRPDLAMRQLEATAKKGGEWGEEAKKRLKILYGMETTY